MISNDDYIKGRFGLAIRKLLDKNKRLKLLNDKKGIKTEFEHSYEGISSATGLRVATISDIIKGKSNVKAITLNLILDAMGVTYTEFGKAADQITLEQIKDYIQSKAIKG